MSLIPILVCVGLAFSTNVFAASCSGVDTSILECEGGGDSGVNHILSSVLEIMTIGIGILAVLGITWAGIQYLTSGSDTARATKARRRLLEIVVGVICYVLIYGFLSWLTPGGTNSLDLADTDDSGVSDISISYSGKTYVGQTFIPEVVFNGDATDKTYSLRSKSGDAVSTSGRGAKCERTGGGIIEVVSANGRTATMTVNCREAPASSTTGGIGKTNLFTSSGSNTTGSQASTKFNGKARFTKETRAIIDKHRRDFYHSNYKSVIKKYGGYNGYVKSLGGVFTKNYKKNKFKIKTAADLQEAEEYILGLLTIWGVDYGRSGATRPWRYGESWNGGPTDRFNAGRSVSASYKAHSGIKAKLTNGNSNINCNDLLDTFQLSTSLKHIAAAGSGQSKGALSKYKRITNLKDLQVGDVVHFYRPGGNPSTGSGWRHVAIVGEVYKDYVVMYDGGRDAVGSGNFKRYTKRYNGRSMTDKYSGYKTRWIAIRPWNIDQNVTLRGLNQ